MFADTIKAHLEIENLDQVVHALNDKAIALNFALNVKKRYEKISPREVVEELKKIGHQGSDWQKVEDSFEQLQNLEEERAFKPLVKAQTSLALNKEINLRLKNGQIDDIRLYLSSLIKCLRKYGQKYEYAERKVVYKGIQGDARNQYKKDQIGYWPCFMSTT